MFGTAPNMRVRCGLGCCSRIVAVNKVTANNCVSGTISHEPIPAPGKTEPIPAFPIGAFVYMLTYIDGMPQHYTEPIPAPANTTPQRRYMPRGNPPPPPIHAVETTPPCRYNNTNMHLRSRAVSPAGGAASSSAASRVAPSSHSGSLRSTSRASSPPPAPRVYTRPS